MSSETGIENLAAVVKEIGEEEEVYDSALDGKNHPWIVKLVTGKYVLVGEGERSGTGDVREACENRLRSKV